MKLAPTSTAKLRALKLVRLGCLVLLFLVSLGGVALFLPKDVGYFRAIGQASSPRAGADKVSSLQGSARSALHDHELLVGSAAPKLAGEGNGAKALFEVCGLGKVAANEFGAPDIKLDDEVINTRLADVASDLTHSEDTLIRATGMYMRAWAIGRSAMDEADKDATCASLQGGGCYEKSRPIGVAKSIEAAAPLLDMARKTTDPAIYSAAMRLCNTALVIRPSACADISALRLTVLDPKNAQSWLHVAAEAARREDSIAEQTALQRATEQPEYVQRRLPLHLVLESERLRDEAPLVNLHIANSLLGYESLSGTEGMSGILQRFCKQPALDLPGRVDACRNLGKTMDAGAVGIIGERFAELLYERTGATKEEVRRRRGEYHALTGFLEDEAGDGYGCAAITKMKDFTYSSLKLGERRTIRERIKAKGETMENLIAKREAAYRAAGKDPYP